MVNAFREAQHDAIRWKPDPDRPDEIQFDATERFSIPLVFAILIGEICYNLRGALDYLVYELAFLDSGKIVEGTQFIIEDKQKVFAFRQKERLNGLNSTHIAAIEALQPYRGCDWTKALRDISNPDKHRRLTFNQGVFDLQVFANADRLRFLNLPGRISSAKHPITGQKMHMQTNLMLEIQLSDGTPVIETLKKIQAEVARTLDAFKPDFEGR